MVEKDKTTFEIEQKEKGLVFDVVFCGPLKVESLVGEYG
jgi:hypothetical protein